LPLFTKQNIKCSGKVFAVKKIHRKGLTIEQQVHVKQEADILRLLAHPNIVKLYSLYEEDTQFDMVMELVTGGELFDRIVAKTSYNESEARDLVSNIAQTLLQCLLCDACINQLAAFICETTHHLMHVLLYMPQTRILLETIKYMHSNNIVHR
jgi:serine/threonine protein kinase